MKKAMKRYSIRHFVAIIVALWVISTGCYKTDDPDSEKEIETRFGIFAPLHWEWNSDTRDLINLSDNITDITLSEEPIISIEDIVSYVWSEHTITLHSSAADKLEALGFPPLLEERPFPVIVVANDERIYLGVFWPYDWKLAPPCPEIYFHEGREDGTPKLTIWEKGDSSDGARVIDDIRVHDALEDAGVLL